MSLSRAEQERRGELLRGIPRDLELDALVLAGADYRGRKGTLRWVGDDNLAHRYGFAVAAPGQAGDGLKAGARQMKPGKRPADVQKAIGTAVGRHRGRCSYSSGRGIGQDVIEAPWLGLEFVQDRGNPRSRWKLEEHMVLSNHPYVEDEDDRAIGYTANTHVVTPQGGESLSQLPLDVFVVR